MEPIKRMTEKQSDGTYLIYANMLAPINENAFAGPAAERLAAFENAVEIAQSQLAATTAKIERQSTGFFHSATCSSETHVRYDVASDGNRGRITI